MEEHNPNIVKYLIDAYVIINHINKKSDLLTKFKGKHLCMSVLTIFELYLGAESQKDIALLDDLLRYFEKIDVNYNVSQKAAGMGRHGNLSNIGVVDLILAATSIEYKLVLVTGNKKHFKMIAGIEIY